MGEPGKGGPFGEMEAKREGRSHLKERGWGIALTPRPERDLAKKGVRRLSGRRGQKRKREIARVQVSLLPRSPGEVTTPKKQQEKKECSRQQRRIKGHGASTKKS